MNSAQQRSKSLWMGTKALSAPALEQRETTDVVVVGSGIAGLSVAYECARNGASVIVLDRGSIAQGISARTTAHLASALDDTYGALISLRGEDDARACYDSQRAAIDRIEEIQKEEGIACDFKRVDGFLFAPTKDDVSELEREMQACHKVGFKGVEWAKELAVDGAWSRALRFPAQARFHPAKYLLGLYDAIRKRGGRFFANSPVSGVEEKLGRVTVKTDKGTVSASQAVFATNSPTNDLVAVHTKQAPYRTYAIAATVKRGAIPDALYWDTQDPYHYVRLQPGEQSDFLIIGGEDHKTGEAYDWEARLTRLEDWGRDYFPAMGKVVHRWSGQVMEPIDYLPFIGLNHGNEKVFIVTGDSGQGMTNGALGGMILSALIARGSSRWRQLYDPKRKTLKAARAFVRENAIAVKNFSEYLMPGQVSSVDDLKRGQGAVVRQGKSKIAAYRDEQGKLYQRSAACTHLGCHLHWNGFERCWECPCHGSHFAPDGAVQNGPAISPLAEAGTESKPRVRVKAAC